MTSSASILALVLLATLVGASMPVLYQIYLFVKRARLVLETTGPRLDQALVQVGQVAKRLNETASSLEAQLQILRPVLEAFSRSGRWLGSAMSIGGAIAPAVMAGARALFSGNNHQGSSSAETEAPHAKSFANVTNNSREGHHEA